MIALVLLVALAGCAGGGGGSGGGAPAGADGGGGSGGGAAPTAGGDAATDLAVGSYYADGERVVVRDASMTVTAEPFDPAFDEARSIARDHGGFVADWTLEVDDGYHRASLTIRVPAENFNAARDGLAALGTVERERVDARDFTDEHRGLGDRLSTLREQLSEVESELESTADEGRRVALLDKRADLRGEIRSLEGDRRALERRADLSTIELTLQEPASSRQPATYQSALGIQLAVLTAAFAGVSIVKYLLAAVGFVIPVAVSVLVLGALGVVLVRLTRRAWVRYDAALVGVGLDGIVGGGPPRRDDE